MTAGGEAFKRKSPAVWSGLFLLLLLLGVDGCNSTPLAQRPKYRFHRPQDQAPAAPVSAPFTASCDDVLGCMKVAMYEHEQGAWGASNAAIERAFRFVANQPDIKLGSTLGATLLNESLQDYKGDPYELVMLHTLGMLNYSFLGQWEEALVEARGANSLIAALEAAGKHHVEDPLNRYYSAKLFERMEQWDDAYIDMVRARQAFRDLAPVSKVQEPSFLGGDLLHLALKAGRQDDLGRLEKEYPDRGLLRKAGQGEVWVLVFDGLVFEKAPGASAKSTRSIQSGPAPKPALPLAASVKIGTAQAPLELVYQPALMSKEAMKAKSLGEGLRAFTRFSLRLSLVAGVAVLTQGKGLDPSVLEFVTKDPGQAKRWDNMPARVYACRLFVPAGKAVLRLSGRSHGGDRWLEELKIRVPKDRAGLVQMRIKDQERTAALSPSLLP